MNQQFRNDSCDIKTGKDEGIGRKQRDGMSKNNYMKKNVQIFLIKFTKKQEK